MQITNIEVVARQKDVFASLKSGHSAIKELQKEISLDDVQKLMDETAEAKEYQDVRHLILTLNGSVLNGCGIQPASFSHLQ